MKKALIYASVASMIKQFNMSNIQLLLNQGYEVDVACNMENGSSISQEAVQDMKKELEGLGVRVFHVPVPRSITNVSDILGSLKQTKTLMNENMYSLVHCHSPIGGMICRLANRFSKEYKIAKMIYTAHGFHFFKGAPKKNWLMYYPVEKFCSRFTDVLITINQEDYELAKKKMKAKRVEYVPGVGIDQRKFSEISVDSATKRKEMGIPEECFLLLSVGELNSNKNHEAVLRAVAEIKNKNIHYLIVGQGGLKEYLTNLAAELNISEQVHLAGFRNDVAQLYKISDCFIHPSKREGLPVSIMEAMASGLPVIASNIRGNSDLIEADGLFELDQKESLVSTIQRMHDDFNFRNNKSKNNIINSKNYDKKEIQKCIELIYNL